MLDVDDLLERAAVRPADELRALARVRELLVGIARRRDPLAVRAPAVLRVGIHGGGDVRRQRPRRRRPDHEELAGPLEEREADVERRVGAIDVRADQLVLRDRRAAARAPLGRAVAEVEPVAVVDGLQHPPDVLDVRVAEREVVACPSPSTGRAASSRAQSCSENVTTASRHFARELLEPVLLDLALRVEPELALDADLDPEALAVEAVLVALVEAAERLVALEDVLQRPAPRRVDAERDLFAVTGPSMKENVGPPAFCSRNFANVPSASQRARISSSRRGWSGLSGSGSKIGVPIGKSSLGWRVSTLDRPPQYERNQWQQT